MSSFDISDKNLKWVIREAKAKFQQPIIDAQIKQAFRNVLCFEIDLTFDFEVKTFNGKKHVPNNNRVQSRLILNMSVFFVTERTEWRILGSRIAKNFLSRRSIFRAILGKKTRKRGPVS